MADHEQVHIRCRFSRGGFAHERKFWIAAPSGGDYTGIASIDYCFSLERKPLEPNEPPKGVMMDGYIAARILDRGLGTVTVEVPDGEICDISEDLLEGARPGVLV